MLPVDLFKGCFTAVQNRPLTKLIISVEQVLTGSCIFRLVLGAEEGGKVGKQCGEYHHELYMLA